MESPETEVNKRTFYFIVKKVEVLNTKGECEKFLSDRGGLQEDEIVVRGLEMKPEPKQVFEL